MKSIRTIILAAIAALVLAGFSAATASATNQFRAWSYPTTVKGEVTSEQTIQFAEGNLRCLKGALSGTATEVSNSLTLTPSYLACKTYGVYSPVQVNSCNYVFSENETLPHSRLDIVCGKEGDAIEILPAGIECTIRIPAQSALKSVSFVTTSSSSMKINLGIINLKYSEVGVGCPQPGEHTSSSFAGSYSLTGVAMGSSPSLFQAESYPAKVVSESGDIIFSLGYPTLACTSFSAEGIVSSASSSFDLQPKTWGCTAFGVKAPVENHGCYFRLHASPISDFKTEGSTDIVCSEAGAAITLTMNVYFCEYRFPAQSGIKSLSYTNEGSKSSRIVKTKVNLSGIEYIESGWGCESPGTHKDGGLSGTWPLKAYMDESGFKGPQTGFWVG